MPLRFSVLKNTTINMEKMLCIQSIVEKPSLYIIGRCLSNDQQLLYFHIRLEDISLIRENLKTSDGIPVRDKMPIFKDIHLHTNLRLANKHEEIFFAVLAVFKGISWQIFNITASKKPQFTRTYQ